MGKSMAPIDGDRLKEFLKTLFAESGDQYVVLAQLGFSTGLRISDLLKLKYGQFKRQKRVLQIKEQKTNKIKRIEITAAMREPVLELKKNTYSSDEDWVFSVRAGKPMSRTTAYRHIKAAGARCNLTRVGPHSLRKTYAVNKFIESYGDIEFVREAMNHKYSETTLYSYLLAGLDIGELLKKVLL